MYSNRIVDPTTTALQVEHERPRRHVEIKAVLVAGKIRFILQVHPTSSISPPLYPTFSIPPLPPGGTEVDLADQTTVSYGCTLLYVHLIVSDVGVRHDSYMT